MFTLPVCTIVSAVVCVVGEESHVMIMGTAESESMYSFKPFGRWCIRLCTSVRCARPGLLFMLMLTGGSQD